MNEIHKFYESHSSEIDWEVFQKILTVIEGNIDGRYHRELWELEEDDNSITFNAEISYWVYHDETEYKTCKIIFVKEEDINSDNVEWISVDNDSQIKDIPCKGIHIVDKNSYHHGDWFYDKGNEAIYLFLEPFGLKGVWRYHIIKGEYRE